MITIKEVTNKRDLNQFIKFPNQLYKNVPLFTPTLNFDEKQNLNPKVNPASEYCDQKLFLAYEDDQIVGRLGVIINHSYNKKKNIKQLRFTRYDVIDKFEVSEKLFAKAYEYARENQLNEIIGPIGFCDLDKLGLLVEGFDEKNLFITVYNHPYYLDHLTKLGFIKDVDWVEFQVKPSVEGMERIIRISNNVEKKYGFYIEKFKSKIGIRPTIQACFKMINEAYKDLYGVVYLTERQIEMYISQFITLVNLEYVYILHNKEGKIIGFGLMVPRIADAVKKAKGQLFPFGFVRVFHSLKTEKILEMYIMAIDPEYQNMGANAVIMKAACESIQKKGITLCETGPELEDNVKIQSQWKLMDVRQHRRRRCLKKTL